MLEIWGRKNSSNVIPVMWTVGELGLEHTRHNVGGSFGGLDTDDYGTRNPNRTVPTIGDDGFVLWESNPIVRYLSRRYGSGSLYPEDPRQAALADQWMEWFKANVLPGLIPIFFALVRLPREQSDPARIAELARTVGEKLMILDRHLKGRRFVVGEDLTMGDIPAGAWAYRYYHLDIERPSLPNVESWYARLCERAPYRTHAMIPIGRSPEEWLELERAGA